MKKIYLSEVTKKIHFPVIQAVYSPTPKRSWYRKVINFITYRRSFKFREDYILWCPFIDQYIFIPKYFYFDGASVPKILNGLFNPTGMLLLGAGPHDFGYYYMGLFHINLKTGHLFFKPYTRNQLDQIFKNLCAYESGMKIASNVATYTVRVGGFFPWKKNKKINRNLFKDFPELYVQEEYFI